MTKKEMHSAINKQVYNWLDERNIPFELEMGGRVTVMIGKSSDDWFDYHQSRHEVCILNWASDEAKLLARELEEYIDVVINQVGEAA